MISCPIPVVIMIVTVDIIVALSACRTIIVSVHDFVDTKPYVMERLTLFKNRYAEDNY